MRHINISILLHGLKYFYVYSSLSYQHINVIIVRVKYVPVLCMYYETWYPLWVSIFVAINEHVLNIP